MDIDLKRIRDLAKLLYQFDLSEVDLRQGDSRVRLRREATGEDTVPVASIRRRSAVASAQPPADAEAPATKTPAAEEDANVFFVTSPFVGTFYPAAAPEAQPFTDIGQTVAAGQVLCIVEAMKLMNEIEADQPGKVLEVLVENGKPVEYGQRLFKMQRL